MRKVNKHIYTLQQLTFTDNWPLSYTEINNERCHLSTGHVFHEDRVFGQNAIGMQRTAPDEQNASVTGSGRLDVCRHVRIWTASIASIYLIVYCLLIYLLANLLKTREVLYFVNVQLILNSKEHSVLITKVCSAIAAIVAYATSDGKLKNNLSIKTNLHVYNAICRKRIKGGRLL